MGHDLSIDEQREDCQPSVVGNDLQDRERTLYESFAKRWFDILGAIVLLALTAPIMAGTALVVRRSLGRGIVFVQMRVGVHGRPFRIYKFRTMHHDRRKREARLPEGFDRRRATKCVDDPRHTRVGRILRRYSLDELPQLINVLRGDMSLVGPRPELHSFAIEHGLVEHVRHETRPGMTGPFQVSALRCGGDLRAGFHLDVEYVNSITLRNDLKYLARTVASIARSSTIGS